MSNPSPFSEDPLTSNQSVVGRVHRPVFQRGKTLSPPLSLQTLDIPSQPNPNTSLPDGLWMSSLAGRLKEKVDQALRLSGSPTDRPRTEYSSISKPVSEGFSPHDCSGAKAYQKRLDQFTKLEEEVIGRAIDFGKSVRILASLDGRRSIELAISGKYLKSVTKSAEAALATMSAYTHLYEALIKGTTHYCSYQTLPFGLASHSHSEVMFETQAYRIVEQYQDKCQECAQVTAAGNVLEAMGATLRKQAERSIDTISDTLQPIVNLARNSLSEQKQTDLGTMMCLSFAKREREVAEIVKCLQDSTNRGKSFLGMRNRRHSETLEQVAKCYEAWCDYTHQLPERDYRAFVVYLCEEQSDISWKWFPDLAKVGLDLSANIHREGGDSGQPRVSTF